MNPKYFVLAGCVATALSLPCYADLLFDNADSPLTTTNRNSAIEGVAAYLQVGTSDVTIGQIAIHAQPLQNGQLKFVIFSDVAPPGNDSGALLFSNTVSVSAANSLSYILSAPFSFTLQAGHYYDIGAIFSGTNINYTYDFVSDTENGITSIVSNQNVNNFANPTLIGHAVSDISIQLYSPAAATPESASFALAAMGLACIGLAGSLRWRHLWREHNS